MQQLFLSLPNGKTRIVPLDHKMNVYNQVQSIFPFDFYLLDKLSGKVLFDSQKPPSMNSSHHLEVRYRLVGGKGGFGTQLKAMGDKMAAKKTENYDSSRDLQGRRIRTVKRHKLVTEWIKNEPKRKQELKQKLEDKISKLLDAKHKKFVFEDTKYINNSKQVVESIDDFVKRGMETRSEEPQQSNQKPKALFGMDDEFSSDELSE